MESDFLSMTGSFVEITHEVDRTFLADNMFSKEDYNYIFRESSEDDPYDKILRASAMEVEDTENMEKTFYSDDGNYSSGFKMESEKIKYCADPSIFLNNVHMSEPSQPHSPTAGGPVPETPPDTPPMHSGSSSPTYLQDSPPPTATAPTSLPAAVESASTELVKPRPFVVPAVVKVTLPPRVESALAAARAARAAPAAPPARVPGAGPSTARPGVSGAQGNFTHVPARNGFPYVPTTIGASGAPTTVVMASKVVIPSPAAAPSTVGRVKVTPVGPVIPAASVGRQVATSSGVPIIKTEPLAVVNGALSPNTASLLQQVNDAKAIKRQQRMIKNRESACLSRKKRKEYLQKLEHDVRDLTDENSRLKQENTQLRQRVAQLESQLHKAASVPTAKKTTAVMAIMFLLTLNFAPFSLLSRGPLAGSGGKQELYPAAAQNHRLGRHLLWSSQSGLPDDGGNFVPDLQPPVPESPGDLPAAGSEAEPSSAEFLGALDAQSGGRNGSVKCPSDVNQTESLRETDGRGQNYFQLYQALRRSYEQLYEAIQRKDDTFYFVSFSGDYLLLSANSENRTRMPRMSLVMPAGKFNASTRKVKAHVPMMQIDCEVMSTKIMYVKESVIPPHLRQQHPHNNPLALRGNPKLKASLPAIKEAKPGEEDGPSYLRSLSQGQLRNHTRAGGGGGGGQ
ncbi:bZIP_ATF6 domain-containing protein ATf6 isoform X2 [Haemaphysalis longicornis]